uniref:RRM domain-containing protein n=1 Tax=Triticum urartu TaxID=4572 RepID=A0A8R7UKV1_TRIUA
MPRPDAKIGNPERAPSYIRMPRFPSPSPRLLRLAPAAGPQNPNPLRQVDPARPALSATSRQRWPLAIHLRPPHIRSTRIPSPPPTRPRPPPTRSTRLPWPTPTLRCSPPTRSTRPARRRRRVVWRSGALPTEQGSLTVLPPPPPPPPQGAPVMKTVQGVNMMAPTPLQGPPVMQRANTVVPMPLRELLMTVPLQGRPVMAPLPFPGGPPSMMAPPSFYDVASPMTVQQPPHADYMMGQPLLCARPPPVAALHHPHAVHMVAQPPLPAGPPPLKRHHSDYFDMPFGPQMTGFELEMAGFNESTGLPYGPYINNEMPSVGSYEPHLPLDASSTLHVEGFPPNCTRRELAHIFRPFTGFCAVRLVNT